MISQKKKKLLLIIFLYGIFNIQRKNYQEGYLAGDKKILSNHLVLTYLWDQGMYELHRLKLWLLEYWTF